MPSPARRERSIPTGAVRLDPMIEEAVVRRPGLRLLVRIVQWFRAGYPIDAPRQGHVAVLAVLRRQMSDLDVARVADELIGEAQELSSPISRRRIARGIKRSLLQDASADEVARVKRELASKGWSVTDAVSGEDLNGRDGTTP
jgi:hypothetical protein